MYLAAQHLSRFSLSQKHKIFNSRRLMEYNRERERDDTDGDGHRDIVDVKIPIIILSLYKVSKRNYKNNERKKNE